MCLASYMCFTSDKKTLRYESIDWTNPLNSRKSEVMETYDFWKVDDLRAVARDFPSDFAYSSVLWLCKRGKLEVEQQKDGKFVMQLIIDENRKIMSMESTYLGTLCELMNIVAHIID